MIPLNTGNSTGQNYAQVNDLMRQFNNEKTAKTFRRSQGDNAIITGRLPDDLGYGTLLYDSDGNARIAMYIDEDGNPVFKVSEEGQDATTAADSDLIFNSAQNVFKIVTSGTVTQTLSNAANLVSAGKQSVTIAHNLGYVPAFLIYVTAPSTFMDGAILFQLPHSTFFNDGSANDGLFFTYFYGTVDSTNLTINYVHNRNTDYSPQSPAFTVRYYLLQETAS